ncbi:sulfur carrier protein ThiS [Glycomyces xiaoerkulensis]|uniref:sulfur carrier protein ThiS n=1 Tax=Glycomyces xiaoerkulensis TaxID=2038139 RepID=UPI0012FFD42B|nr:sulfur carrier protein ThiS [Glycomyces xiaoerkulensis]
MKIELNGRTREGVESVADAVREELGRADPAGLGRGTAVAVNGEVVPRSEWDRTLADGDAVEVLTATQGG